MKGNTIEGLYKEEYGKYDGKFIDNELQTYLTTDRYFEKYLLLTDAGVYEIWAGGCKKIGEAIPDTFKKEIRFEALSGLKVLDVTYIEEKLLVLQFGNNQYFEIGLCPDYNSYNHPERYMKFCKK